MTTRRVTESELVNDSLDGFHLTDEEYVRLTSCLKALAVYPERGEPVVFSGYPGDHRVVECGRVLVIYQFSDAEVRIKDVQLSVAYDG